MRGRPLTLVGPALKVGDQAPDFTAVDTKLQDVTLGSAKGKTRIFSVIPSLDTPVCDLQTKRFNEEAGKLGDAVVVYTVSADLPFAAGRWCGANGAKNVQCISDHRSMSFGNAWGTHVKELRLDARAVFVVDAKDKLVHAEYVKEIAEHPNYDAARPRRAGSAQREPASGRARAASRRRAKFIQAGAFSDLCSAGAASRAPSRPRPRRSCRAADTGSRDWCG
jgi:thiol peroxidase